METALASRDDAVQNYLDEVVRRLDQRLGSDLVGVYVGGSFALGGFDFCTSDLDVVAVSAERLDNPTKLDVVLALRHDGLPCPVRGLEFVLYAQPSPDSRVDDRGLELNLNSGSRMAFCADNEPRDTHWFAIDRAVLVQHGRTLHGPPAQHVFDPPPRLQLLDAVGETIVHHWEKGDKTSDAVLNACRALRYADEVVWSSKLSAGVWAIERQYEPRLVAQALAVRHSPDQFAVDDVDGFLQRTCFAVQLIACFEGKSDGPCATSALRQ